MPEIINANGSVCQSTGGLINRAILSSTHATPIVVQFSAAHGANENDTWEINGHQTNYSANGVWQVHVVDSTHLQLNGSVGIAVGSSTGLGVNYAVNPLLQVPDDTDNALASSANTPIEGVFNNVPYLYRRAGGFSLYQIASLSEIDTVANIGSAQTLAGGSTFADTFYVGSDVAYAVDQGLGPIPMPVNTGDYLDIEYQVLPAFNSGGFAYLAIGVKFNGGSWNYVGGSTQAFASDAGAVLFSQTLRGAIASVPNAYPNTNTISVGVMVGAVGAGTILLRSPSHITIKHYRSNA